MRPDLKSVALYLGRGCTHSVRQAESFSYTLAMIVLGFESSCDETGVALVDAAGDGVPRLLAHALYSQIDMHQAYGGVVPELASRDHIRRVLPLTSQVLSEAGCS